MPIKAITKNTTFTAQLAPETVAKLNESANTPEWEKMLSDEEMRIAKLGDQNTIITLFTKQTSGKKQGLIEKSTDGVYAIFKNTSAPNLHPAIIKIADKLEINVKTLTQITRYLVESGEKKLCESILKEGKFNAPSDYFASLIPRSKTHGKFISRILKQIRL